MKRFHKFPNGTQMASFESGTTRSRKQFPRASVRRGLGLLVSLGGLLLTTSSSLGQNISLVTTAQMMIGPGHEMVGIPCQINGAQRRYVCVIDSGATYTVVSDRVVRAAGPTIELTTGNGMVRVHQREVSLTIAEGLELKSKALVQRRMLRGVDILVGQDVLRQFKYVTFDYENRKVEFQR